MTVAWWCSGSGGDPWTWTYTPLLGVWLLVGTLVGLRELAYRRWAPTQPPEDTAGPQGGGSASGRGNRAPTQPPEDTAGPQGGGSASGRGDRAAAGTTRSPREEAYFYGGVLAILAVSEWPLGPLGAGYLISVGMLRYLVYSFFAARWLVLGTPSWMWQRLLTTNPTVKRAAALLTRWQMGLLVFNAALVITHLPPVVDTLKVYQAGSFALDMVWLLAGLIMWWPVYGKVDALPRLGDPGREAYLFGQSVIPTAPASFLTFAALPLYGLYELAPPVWLGYDIVADQRVAGLLMKIGGGLTLWITIAWLFLRWANRQERIDRGVATEADLAAEVASWEGRGHPQRQI